jgi:hypothetical protein
VVVVGSTGAGGEAERNAVAHGPLAQFLPMHEELLQEDDRPECDRHIPSKVKIKL